MSNPPVETTALLANVANQPDPPIAEELLASRALPSSTKLCILAGTLSAQLLGSIDMSVMAAINSAVASSFHASHEAGWLGTSYLWASLSLTPLYGRLCDIIGRRAASGLAIGLFLVGTLGCAVAPNMYLLIVARFVAGAGGGGIATTNQIIAADLFTLKQRGLVTAFGVGAWAIGGALGGPLGGYVTDKFGWRAAFSVQVPFLTLCLCASLATVTYPVASRGKESALEKLARVDFLGSLLLFLSTGSALAFLSLKNSEFLPWSDSRVILSMVLAALFLALFLVVEGKYAKEPILSFRIATQRTPAMVCAMAVFVAVCNFGTYYSLPQWFLAVQGTTVSEAGAHLLAITAGNVVGGLLAGLIIHRTGQYLLPMRIIGILPIGATLQIAFLRPESSWVAKWVGIFPLGIGFGFLVNATNIAIMAAIPHHEIPIMTGFLWLFRSLGQLGGVALTSSILQAVLVPQLTKRITGTGADEIIRRIRENSAQIGELSGPLQIAARESFRIALRYVFIFCASMAFLGWLFASSVPQLDLDGNWPNAAQSKKSRDEDDA